MAVSMAVIRVLEAEHGITVRPYAGGWWLLGEKINRVVGELDGLSESDLSPLPIMTRY